jgi:hypothetical protein
MLTSDGGFKMKGTRKPYSLNKVVFDENKIGSTRMSFETPPLPLLLKALCSHFIIGK